LSAEDTAERGAQTLSRLRVTGPRADAGRGEARFRRGACYHRRARGCGLLFENPEPATPVPNIRQQEKRVKIAARQRLENLRYRSTIKTLAKRLEATVLDDDVEAVSAAHLALVRTIDKAASHGAIHQNTAARKKSQAARVVAGSS
jgi:small subunit ribosomal protein S20